MIVLPFRKMLKFVCYQISCSRFVRWRCCLWHLPSGAARRLISVRVRRRLPAALLRQLRLPRCACNADWWWRHDGRRRVVGSEQTHSRWQLYVSALTVQCSHTFDRSRRIMPARAHITACPTTAAIREWTTRCHHFSAPLVTLVDMPAALNLRPPTAAGVVLKIMASLVLLGELNYLSKRQFLPDTARFN